MHLIKLSLCSLTFPWFIKVPPSLPPTPIVMIFNHFLIFAGKIFIRDFVEELKLHDIEVDEVEIGNL